MSPNTTGASQDSESAGKEKKEEKKKVAGRGKAEEEGAKWEGEGPTGVP